MEWVILQGSELAVPEGSPREPGQPLIRDIHHGDLSSLFKSYDFTSGRRGREAGCWDF